MKPEHAAKKRAIEDEDIEEPFPLEVIVEEGSQPIPGFESEEYVDFFGKLFYS